MQTTVRSPSPAPKVRHAAWVRPAQLVLLAAGLVLLGYSLLTLTEAYLYQKREGLVFDRMLQKCASQQRALDSVTPESAKRTEARPGTQPSSSHAGPGWGSLREPIARIEIPEIGLDALVLEGDDSGTLRLGAGHIPGTALPGGPGNVGIAGHRDTFFRCLRKIDKNASITLRTLRRTYQYRVDEIVIVDPTQLAVLAPTAGHVLTLVTCYPFNFLGAAPERFIVHARQVSAGTSG